MFEKTINCEITTAQNNPQSCSDFGPEVLRKRYLRLKVSQKLRSLFKNAEDRGQYCSFMTLASIYNQPYL